MLSAKLSACPLQIKIYINNYYTSTLQYQRLVSFLVYAVFFVYVDSK